MSRMKNSAANRWRRAGRILCPAFGVLLLFSGAGCGRGRQGTAAETVGTENAGKTAAPSETERNERTRDLLDSLRKRVMGRREAKRDVERVVRTLGPLVAEAVRQPECRAGLETLAREQGVSPDGMRERWAAWQEADLLLEAGGNTEAVSPSQAVGVAQWLAGTARGQGMTVNLRESKRLTGAIDLLKWKAAWAEYVLRPEADPKAPGNPGYDRAKAEKQMPQLRAELEILRAKRRTFDARYDPRTAIFAQSRYLLRLAVRFPSADWLFQAYHGGEGGVTRTLKAYLGAAAWPGSPAAAIRTGNGGQKLSFEDVYFTATPAGHAAAFSYLYGRSDDHRHYWWKLRVAAEAIALYRRNPSVFAAVWASLLPGRAKAALWYPDAAGQTLSDLSAVEKARQSGMLVPVGSAAGFVVLPCADDAANAQKYAALRPEAAEMLRKVTAAYREAGGTETLQIGDTTLTQAVLTQRRTIRAILPHLPRPQHIWPPDPDAKVLPGNGPPPDFDFHTIGAAFDVLRPKDALQRKILDYALGTLEDRQALTRYEDKKAVPPHCIVIANPHPTTVAR